MLLLQKACLFYEHILLKLLSVGYTMRILNSPLEFFLSCSL